MQNRTWVSWLCCFSNFGYTTNPKLRLKRKDGIKRGDGPVFLPRVPKNSSPQPGYVPMRLQLIMNLMMQATHLWLVIMSSTTGRNLRGFAYVFPIHLRLFSSTAATSVLTYLVENGQWAKPTKGKVWRLAPLISWMMSGTSFVKNYGSIYCWKMLKAYRYRGHVNNFHLCYI